MATPLKTVADVEKALTKYYKSMGKSYANQLSEFMEESGFEFEDIMDDLVSDIDECTVITDFDDDFPVNHAIKQKGADAVKEERARIMKQIISTGVSQSVQLTSVDDIKMQIKPDTLKKSSKTYQNQTPNIFEQCNTEPDVMKYLAIRSKNNNFPFGQTMHDAYARDKINTDFASVAKWLLQTKLGKKLYQSDKTAYNKLDAGMKGFANRICPLIRTKPGVTIDDDPKEIADYLASGTQFIKNLIDQQKALPPFQVDFIIAVKDVTANAVVDHDGGDDDDIDDDDDDDDDKKDDDPNDIGDVKAKLTFAKCSFSNKTIDDAMKADLSRPLGDIYNDFRSNLNKSNNKPPSGGKGYHKPFDDAKYPHRKRFNIFIDRRKDKPTDDDNKDQKDDAIIFEPPYKFDTLPYDKDVDHVPEWFIESSRQCLVPSGDPNVGPITVTTAYASKIITFSFHVEEADKIKCYMFWNAQVTRFYPEDIVKVFPIVFCKDQYDTFIASDVIEEIYKNIHIKDKQFETFYKDLTNKDAFPDPKFIDDYVKKERKKTKLMIGFLVYAIQKLGTKDNDNWTIKFELLCNDIMFQAIFVRPYLGLCGTLFAAKVQQKITYIHSSIMLRAPDSNDVLITMNQDKAGDVAKISIKIKDFIGKQFEKEEDTKDNLLFLLDALNKSKKDYDVACAFFNKDKPITAKRK